MMNVDSNEEQARKGKAKSPDKRSQISNAAYRCFSDGGYHNTTVDKICSAIGISKGAFYWYFSGKQAVFLSILDEWAERVETDMKRQFADAMAGPNRQEAVTEALEKETRRGRHLMPIWLEFLAQVPRVPKIRETLAVFHRRARRIIKELLAPTLPESFSDEDKDALATVVLAGFIGLLCQELVDPNAANSRDAVRRFMKVVRFYVSEAHVPAQS